MQHLSSREAQNNFGMLLDSVQKNPVIIQKHKRDCAVVISIADYALLRKSRMKELQDLCDEVGKNAKSKGLTPEILDKLLREK
ncbi:MAG: type II toxin-antitoxin system Phd/YefM family antitoxin [Pseudomonadota bacterium]